VNSLRKSGISIMFSLAVSAQVPHQQHPPRDAGEYARVLEDPSRDAWQKPHEVVMALELKPDEAIADIGAGTGYFARRFARHAGKVYAVDIDAKLLEIVAKDAPPNLATVLAAPDDPRLPPSSVDTVFFCDVLHHIDARPAYYGKLARALKPGGRIVVVDFHKRELPVGPPPAMKLSSREVEDELSAAGFRKVKSFEFLPHQYFLVFARK
jgi:arsenite methyltransferase